MPKLQQICDGFMTLDNSSTKQLAVRQVINCSTRRQWIFYIHRKIIINLYI